MENGFFLEGEKLIREAVSAGAILEALFVLEGQEEDWIEWDQKVFVLSESLMRNLSRLATPARVIAMAKLAKRESLETCLQRGTTFLVLDRLQDPGNIGTIIRTAEGLNVDAVFLSSGSCSATNDKTLRAAMGSAFRLPIFENMSAHDLMLLFRRAQIQTIGTKMKGNPLPGVSLPARLAFFFGNEGRGIDRELLPEFDHVVCIPMTGKIESYNVAISASICLYERLRQRRLT